MRRQPKLAEVALVPRVKDAQPFEVVRDGEKAFLAGHGQTLSELRDVKDTAAAVGALLTDGPGGADVLAAIREPSFQDGVGHGALLQDPSGALARLISTLRPVAIHKRVIRDESGFVSEIIETPMVQS